MPYPFLELFSCNVLACSIHCIQEGHLVKNLPSPGWEKLLNGFEERGVRGKEKRNHSRMGVKQGSEWNATLLHVITYIGKWFSTWPLSLALVFSTDLLKSHIYEGVHFPHMISPKRSSFTLYHMVMRLKEPQHLSVFPKWESAVIYKFA